MGVAAHYLNKRHTGTELRAKKRRGVNHARTTTRRMEEPYGIQLVGAGCQNLARRELGKFHASLKFAAACYFICI
ncbi:MAG: hypothetical protein H6R46_51 [Proteobacteria bacterium]|nr:hypothetical protein [Pseudomonadota bacterium]